MIVISLFSLTMIGALVTVLSYYLYKRYLLLTILSLSVCLSNSFSLSLSHHNRGLVTGLIYYLYKR